MKKFLLIGGIVAGVLTLAGCSIVTDNQTSTTSQEETVGVEEQTESVQEPAKQGAKVEVASHKEKASPYGTGPSIVGEVVNNGDAGASFIQITATYYDENGEVVDTAFTFAGDPMVSVEPTKKAPFEIVRMQNIKYATYKLDVTWRD